MSGKINIDDILSQLGADEESSKSVPRRAKPKPERRHAIDEAEGSFSPLPSMPSGQKRYAQTSPEEGEVPENGVAAPVSPPPDSSKQVFGPGPGGQGGHADFGELLVERSVISREQLAAAQGVIKQSPGRRLVEVLIEQGADEEGVQRAAASIAGVPFERVDTAAGLDGGFDGKLLQRLGTEFCKQHSVLPLRVEGTRTVIGATRPDDVFLLDEIRTLLGVSGLKLVMITALDLQAALELVGGGEEDNVDLSEILSDVGEADVEVAGAESSTDEVDLEQQAGESPVIRYVNYIIQTAVKEGASDIHIEPGEKKLKVRFRIDGILFEMMNPPGSMAAAITSRLKIMANLDISERRIPQDGAGAETGPSYVDDPVLVWREDGDAYSRYAVDQCET